MAKAKKLPSGSWRVQVSTTINGKKVKRSFTATSAREAELEAAEWQMSGRELQKDPGGITVEKALEEYIRIKESVLSPATIRGYRTMQRNAFDTIQSTQLKALSSYTVQRWIGDLAQTRGEKTIRNAHGLLSATYSTIIGKPPEWRITLPQKKKPKGDALSKPEIAVLLNGIQGDRMESAILLALWLGLRRSEVAALTWDDIDFEHNTLTVSKALVPDADNNYVVKPPKTTDSERTLRLPPYIRLKLLALKAEGKSPAITNPNILTIETPRLCKRLGLPPYGFHDLRRTMATVGSTLNIADKLVMARGGWNNIATMKKVYQIVLAEAENEADQQYNNFFEALL